MERHIDKNMCSSKLSISYFVADIFSFYRPIYRYANKLIVNVIMGC